MFNRNPELHVMCRKCYKYIQLEVRAKSRSDLAEVLGDYFDLKCTRCHNSNFLHVNDVKAYESAFELFWPTGLGLFIVVGSTLIFSKNGILTNVGLIVGGLIVLSGFASRATSHTTAFNKYRIQMRLLDEGEET